MKLVHWCLVLLTVGFVTNGFGVDYFTQRFNDNEGEAEPFDLLNKSITFTPDGSVDYYGAHVEDISGLPTRYDSHTLRSVSDDSYNEVAFTDDKTFEFYGVSYDRVYIGSNGYLTFGAGDSSLTTSTSWHFYYPRISALMSDINPPAGNGRLYGHQMSDRFVVTFDHVPQYNGYHFFTFQIEIWFDDGRIRISWSEMDELDRVCVVGLSSGATFGTPSGYVESDLSVLVPDYDEDGILDKWEKTYFGHFSSCVATNDFDNDGYDNRSEYICGTHPKDEDSYLSVSVGTASSGPVLSWNSVEGRRYKILRSMNLGLGSYAQIDAVEFPRSSYTNTSGNVGFFKVGVELAD